MYVCIYIYIYIYRLVIIIETRKKRYDLPQRVRGNCNVRKAAHALVMKPSSLMERPALRLIGESVAGTRIEELLQEIQRPEITG